MKLYAPAYYKKFKCIADKCEHSCCIGWEIDIDKETYRKYKKLKNSYAKDILNSISCVDEPCFKLDAQERCPHLDENGLCKIILNVGEDYLCEICREHPRFYNYTDVAEVGLGLSCREASRLVLSSPDYDVMDEVSEVCDFEEENDLVGRSARKKIYKILKSKEHDYKTRLENIYRIFDIEAGEDGFWHGVINTLEYLDDAHREMFLKYSSSARPQDKDKYLERALAYFIYRHLTEASCANEVTKRLSLCLFLERLLASLIYTEKARTLEEIAILASIISEEIEYSEDNTEALMLIGN